MSQPFERPGQLPEVLRWHTEWFTDPGMRLRQLTAGSNEQLFSLVEDSSLRFEQGADPGLDPEESTDRSADTQKRLLDLRNNFVQLNAERLLEAIDAGRIRGPIMAPQIH